MSAALTPQPARLRLTAGRAGFRVWLADGDGLELAEVGVYRTGYRACLAVRGTLQRAGWCLECDGLPGLVVREVEINLPLYAAIQEGTDGGMT